MSENQIGEQDPTNINPTGEIETNQMNKELVTDEEEPKRKKRRKGKFGKTLKAVIRFLFNWDTISLLLSHHPECETFDSHVFKIGKVRLCKGCFLSYPAAYGIPILFIAWMNARQFILESHFYIQTIWWFVIGTGIIAIVNHLLKRFSNFLNNLAKFTRGVWAGFLLVAILAAEPWYYKIIPVVILGGGLTLISIRRQKNMTKTCDECEWQSDYENCPGWKNISINLQNNLNYPPKSNTTTLELTPVSDGDNLELETTATTDKVHEPSD